MVVRLDEGVGGTVYLGGEVVFAHPDVVEEARRAVVVEDLDALPRVVGPTPGDFAVDGIGAGGDDPRGEFLAGAVVVEAEFVCGLLPVVRKDVIIFYPSLPAEGLVGVADVIINIVAARGQRCG